VLGVRINKKRHWFACKLSESKSDVGAFVENCRNS